MKVVIRTVRHLELPDDIKAYAENKIRKFEERLPVSSLVELTFEDLMGPKDGLDKKVHLETDLYGSQEIIFHLKETTADFRSSIDLIQEKFEREIEKFKRSEPWT